MAVSPEVMAQFRTESGLSQAQFASILNDILDMHYQPSTISNWEGGKKNIPGYVQEAIEALMGGTAYPDMSADVPESEEVAKEKEARVKQPDSRPNVPRDAPVVLPAVGDAIANTMESATVEMFRGIGQMVELFGAMFSPNKEITLPDGKMISLVEADGRIIAGDADELGKAWAKLAQQNQWVARVVSSLTVGGAWVDVLAATSGTLVKVYRNHADYAAWVAAQSNGRKDVVPEPGSESGAQVDNSVI